MLRITFLMRHYFPAPPNPFCVPCGAEAMDFKVFKLDQESGILIDVKNLEDQVFTLSNEWCFSIAAQGLAGVEGNCILFNDRRPAHSRVFNLEDDGIKNLEAFPGCSRILSPPSTWLSSE